MLHRFVVDRCHNPSHKSGMDLKHPIIIFGGGAMGGALAREWYASKITGIYVVERDPVRRAALSAGGIRAFATLEDVPVEKSILVLAIKPQQMATLGEATLARIGQCRLLISIMAGVSLAALAALSPHSVRVMPNLPAQIAEGMSVACAPSLDAGRRNTVTTIFGEVGRVAWVEDEALLHAVTAISGSGPAYLFAFMEALEEAAVAQGLDATLARILVGQTMRGAALLATESEIPVAGLRQQVTSPGGTTEAALAMFIQHGLCGLVARAVEAAAERSKALGSS